MKKLITLIVATFVCCITISAKDIKVLTVKTTPEIHCTGCETKIKNNIRFVKGVKRIETNLDKKEIEVTYDADKTNTATIIEAFKKLGYEAAVVEEKKADNENHKIDGKTEATAQQQ